MCKKAKIEHFDQVVGFPMERLICIISERTNLIKELTNCIKELSNSITELYSISIRELSNSFKDK